MKQEMLYEDREICVYMLIDIQTVMGNFFNCFNNSLNIGHMKHECSNKTVYESRNKEELYDDKGFRFIFYNESVDYDLENNVGEKEIKFKKNQTSFQM